jgi:hypothetical protein
MVEPNGVAKRCDMGLRGQFSNLSRTVSDLLSNSLTAPDVGQEPSQVTTARGWPDGRHRFGTVSAAIFDALAACHEVMSVRDIRTAVELRLGGAVSRFSVSDYLLTRSKGSSPLFQRTRHGHYRLLC